MLQTGCGYTPAQIREIELPDVARLSRYLKRHVPLRDLVEAIARAIGIEIPTGEKPQYMTVEELKRLVDMTGGRIDGMANWHG